MDNPSLRQRNHGEQSWSLTRRWLVGIQARDDIGCSHRIAPAAAIHISEIISKATRADTLTRVTSAIVDYRNNTPIFRRALLPCDKQEEGGIDVSTSRIRT